MIYKTGLLPAPFPPELSFGAYLLGAQLPAIPATFGPRGLFTGSQFPWGLLNNSKLADCTVAGSMHCIMLYFKMAGQPVPLFTDADARDDYFAITGGEDAGADMVTVVKYWQKTGFRDSQAKRHQIGAYMAVNPQNLEHVYAGAYLFGAVGLGVQLPSSAEYQFIRGEPWANVHGDTIGGYHFVPLIGRTPNGNAVVVTWGREHEVEQSWLGVNLRECIAMVSEEALVNDKSIQGFDMTALLDDLDIIAQA